MKAPLEQWRAIVALGRNRVIGCEGKLPWHLPGDLAFFKKMTTGATVLMGRKTFASIGRALPKRENWVLTREAGFGAEGVRVFGSLEEAVAAGAGRAVWVIGGAEVYAQALPWCSELYVTRVDLAPDGDATMPRFEETHACAEVVETTELYRIERYVHRALVSPEAGD